MKQEMKTSIFASTTCFQSEFYQSFPVLIYRYHTKTIRSFVHICGDNHLFRLMRTKVDFLSLASPDKPDFDFRAVTAPIFGRTQVKQNLSRLIFGPDVANQLKIVSYS